jgi:branched-chain amino acid transport system ATP-binding protein
VPEREPVLEVDELSVAYGSVVVVRGVSLTVGRGEVVGLVGPNGAGKSTTLHAIMGVVPALAGDVRHAGRSLRGLRPEDVVRAGIALVPEGRHVFPRLTVAENLRLGLVGRRTRDGVDADLDHVRSLFPVVAEAAGRHAGALSGGQQQQLAIARALVARPDVLLLDEPSLGLSPTMVDTVFAALTAVRESGVTILLVEQRAQLAVRFCDRTYVLNGGEVRETMTAADADDERRLVAAYFGS